MTDKVEIKKLGDKYFVFSPRDVELLRTKYRIVGALNGTLPQFPLQNTFYGLPLILLPEEVELLINRGWANIIQKSSSATGTTTTTTTTTVAQKPHVTTATNIILQEQKKMSATIFDYFWSQGYYITSGMKFGGQFLLYPDDPMCVHSEYIISIRNKHQKILPLELIGMGRAATNVKKTFVLAAKEKDQVLCYSIEWAGF